MRNLHNRKTLKPQRKELRNSLTPAEAALWRELQHSKLDGRKFRRQHSIGSYVVDYYCPSEQLVIELDGGSHDTDAAWRHDEKRAQFLISLGLRVLRFENRLVFENLEGVLAEIRKHFQ